MKKSFFFYAAAALAMFGLSSCESTTEPRMVLPENGSVSMETSVDTSSLLTLVDGEDFEIAWTTPDYGYNAAVNYEIQVAIDKDFAKYEVVNPIQINYAEESRAAGLNTALIADKDLSQALCNLYGFSADYYEDLDPAPVYFRVLSSLGFAGSEVYSEVLTFEKVKFFQTEVAPGVIYLIGDLEGWKGPDAENAEYLQDWVLNETEGGSKIYMGTFPCPAGKAEFRFYTALTGWDGGASIGHQEADVATTFDVPADGVFKGECVNGKGSWKFPDYEGGNIAITVDLNNMTVEFKFLAEGEIDWDTVPCIYIVGDAGTAGWNATGTPDKFEQTARLYDVDGDGVYENVVPIPLTEGGYFRFYQTLGDWGGDGELPSIGPLPNDNTNEQLVLTDGTYSWDAVPGKGSWVVTESGDYNISINLSNLDGGIFPTTFTIIR